MDSFVFNEILRRLQFQSSEFNLYHWLSADKREIDILIDSGEILVGVEVKAFSTVDLNDFRHLKWFADKGPGKYRPFKGIVFYLGKRKLTFGDGCYALPVSSLWAKINTEH